MSTVAIVVGILAVLGWIFGGKEPDPVQVQQTVAATATAAGFPIPGEAVGGIAALVMAVLRFATRRRSL